MVRMKWTPVGNLARVLCWCVCAHLQDKGLHLQTAVWTVKQTRSWFSVSFFWGAGSGLTDKPTKKKRKVINVAMGQVINSIYKLYVVNLTTMDSSMLLK